jgi:hypothetical protein
MAGLFIGKESLQDVIDLAVSEFLDRLREDAPRFVEALEAAEHEQQRRAGVQSVDEAGPTRMRKL